MKKFGSNRLILTTVLAVAVQLCSAIVLKADGIVVKDGDTVAFLGDSITAQGAATPAGYVRLVESGLAANGVKITVIPAGISGNTSKDEIARIETDVIDKKPAWVTISCGVNDVWHGAKGVALEPYKQNMRSMVDQFKAAGIKPVILTSTPIGEDLDNANNQKLKDYNDYLRELARDAGCPLADLNSGMQAELEKLRAAPHPPGTLLTVDGVHMNPMGNQVMARGVLGAFGLNDDELAKAQSAWAAIPSACDLQSKCTLTIPDYEKLYALAARQQEPVANLLNKALTKAVQDLLAQSPTTAPAN